MGELVLIYELMKREDGTACGIGSSLEVPAEEATRLVAEGTYKYPDVPMGVDSSKDAKFRKKLEDKPVVSEVE